MSYIATVGLNGDPEEWRNVYWDIKRAGGVVVGSPESWLLGTARPFYMGDEAGFLESMRVAYEEGAPAACQAADFSFLFCSARRRRMVLARDWSGLSSVYYSVRDASITVASNVYELLERLRTRRFCVESCYEYLAYEFVADPRTLFEGVYTVPRGWELSIEPFGKITPRPSSLSLTEIDSVGAQDIPGELRKQIVAAVGKRLSMRNGVYLSGGIDSSALAISLKKDLGVSDLVGLTFSTKRAAEDESLHAKHVAKQLGIDFHHVVVDPGADVDLERMVQQSNFPYPGILLIGRLMEQAEELGLTGINMFAGQDTRLHTPGYNPIDRLILCTLLNRRQLRKVAAGSAGLAKHLLVEGRAKRAAERLATASDIGTYIAGNLLHGHTRSSVLTHGRYAQEYSQILAQRINDATPDPLTPRRAFNLVVDTAWGRQYTDDIAYMVGVTESYGNRCSMPFYDRTLALFSASLPMELALKTTRGRAGHSGKFKRVNKYLLRMAFSNELTDDLVYRDKAVCTTAFQYLNCSLGRYVAEYFPKPRLAGGELHEVLGLRALFDRGLQRNGRWRIGDHQEVAETCNLLFLEQISRTFGVS